MNIYLPSGYLDIEAILNQHMTFNFITGARGTGKTYGTLKYLVEHKISFIMLRRTANEMELMYAAEKMNPFNKLNKDMGWNYGVFKASKYTALVYDREKNGDGKFVPKGEPIGLVLALSTVANIRGFDGSEFDFIFYDEFIPEAHVRAIKNEDQAFLNCYETINRNRELEGKPPVTCLCASNSNRLDNAIYQGLGFITKVDEMKQKKQMVSIMPKRSTILVNMEDSPISEQKRNTALYKLTAGSEFEKMALDNEYLGEENRGTIISKNLREYKPLVTVGDITVYEHKSKTEFYVSTHRMGTPPTLSMSKTDKKRLHQDFGYVYFNYLRRNVIFESRLCEILFTKAFE